MCKDTRDRDRESLRTSALWKLRAQVFGELHPSLETLELTLFQAQGYQNEKQCYKESYHATWRDIIQDEGRAHAILRHSVGLKPSRNEEGRCRVCARICATPNPKNTWEGVFDVSSVRGGSFRMPFCLQNVHKCRVHKCRVEHPILPSGASRFEMHGGTMLRRCVCEHGTHGNLPDDVEWVKRGRVRLFQLLAQRSCQCLHPGNQRDSVCPACQTSLSRRLLQWARFIK